MPKTTSAKKALRQNVRRKAENLTRKQNVKSVVKQYRKFLNEGKIEEAKEILPSVYKTIDKVTKKNLIKKGKANRMKSRLTKKLPK